MSLLTEAYIKERDIDWYCLINGVPTHVASMGGIIPQKFRDRKKLRHNQDKVAKMVVSCDARLNMKNIEEQTVEGYDYLENELIRMLIDRDNRNNVGFMYLNDYELRVKLFASSFVEKARRGFRSFARQEESDVDKYVLIAEPETPINSIAFSDCGLFLEELDCDFFQDRFIISD